MNERLGHSMSGNEKVVKAVVACLLGAVPGEVSTMVDWREFESLCADLFRAKGYVVRQNLVITKPRMQVDILARSGSLAFAVDCKHWARSRGPSGLAKVAEAQLGRVASLRCRLPDLEPTCAVILLIASEQERFVRGAAVVPISTLSDFLDNADSFGDSLRFF